MDSTKSSLKLAVHKLSHSSLWTLVVGNITSTENPLVWFGKSECGVSTDYLPQLPGTPSSRLEATALPQLGSTRCRIPRNPDGDMYAREFYGIYAQSRIFFSLLLPEQLAFATQNYQWERIRQVSVRPSPGASGFTGTLIGETKQLNRPLPLVMF